jgi:hypothetical protein
MGGEIIFLIPTLLGYTAVATLVGTLLLWLVWLGARHWISHSRNIGLSRFPAFATASVIFVASLIVSSIQVSQPVPQPASARTVAAFELPLTTAVDRANFLTILTAEAASEGLDVKVETVREMEHWAEMSPELRKSIDVTVYRGGDLHQREAYVSDQFHFGHVWISFSQGEDPALARRFRDRLMSQTIQLWPETLSVPVAQTGSLPHKEDLVRTDAGYEVSPARLAGYVCGTDPGNAPLSACD